MVYLNRLLRDGLPPGSTIHAYSFIYKKAHYNITVQCLVWNTYGPIDEAMNYAYGWSDSTVAFMANWGTIMFVVSVVPLSLMLEKRYVCTLYIKLIIIAQSST